MDSKLIRGVVLAILSAVSFGCMPVFVTYAYREGANAITVVFIRNLLSAVLLFGILIRRKIDIRVDKTMLMKLAILGMTGSAGTALTLYMSYKYISVGLATILHFIYPMVVATWSVVIYKEKMNKRKLISLIMSVLGVYILIGFSEIRLHPLGIFYAILSGLLYSIYILGISKSEIKELDSKVLILYVSIFSAIMTFMYGAATNNIKLVFSTKFTLSISGLIVVSTLGLLLVAHAVRYIGATNVSILSTFEPITSIAFGCMLFSEVLTPSIVIGSAMIIASIRGIIMSQRDNVVQIEKE